MSKKLRVGIIGSGFGQYGLLPAFNSVKNCEVVALCGRKRPQLVEYCAKIGFTNIYSDWRLFLDNEKLDAVAIAVTPVAQYEIAKAAIQKGLHVFAEKPLTASLAEAKELLALARAKKVVHGVDFIFPEIAEWQAVKRMIDDRTLGKLQNIAANWDFLSYDIRNKVSSWKTDAKAGGGALSFYFSHGLYYLENFAGHIVQVSGCLSHSNESLNGAEVGADLVLKFKNGVTGQAHVSANNRDPARHRLVFQCEKGVIILENKDKVVDNFSVGVIVGNKEKFLKIKKDKDQNGEDERVKIVRKLAVRFVSSCLQNKPFTPSFADGVRVEELIEQIRVKTI